MRQRRFGALRVETGDVRFCVWAPRAKQVSLVLIDEYRRRALPMACEPGGIFSVTQTDLPIGQRYAYRLDDGPERPDPCSLWQPDGVHKASAVVFPEHFRWSDRAWRGIARQDLVFYELHVGTFTEAGTFEAIIPRLPELRELGVTALELM